MSEHSEAIHVLRAQANAYRSLSGKSPDVVEGARLLARAHRLESAIAVLEGDQ